MKQINEELDDKKAAICASCGSIFEDTRTIMILCPNCGAEKNGLYWIIEGYWTIIQSIVRRENES